MANQGNTSKSPPDPPILLSPPLPAGSASLLELAGQVLPPDLVEQHPEDDGGAPHGLAGDGVAEDRGGDADGDHLPGGHDDGEDDGPELLDGVVDEELAGGGRDGGDDVVPQDARVAGHELEHPGEVPGQDQARRGDADGACVDPKHHLVRVDVLAAVLGVDPVLPLGGEAVARDVGHHED